MDRGRGADAGCGPDRAVRSRPGRVRPAARSGNGAFDPSAYRASAAGRRSRSHSESLLPSGVFSIATRSPGNAGSARQAASDPCRAGTDPGRQHPVTAQPPHGLVGQRHRRY